MNIHQKEINGDTSLSSPLAPPLDTLQESQLVEQLFNETSAMARYALSNGLPIDARTVDKLHDATTSHTRQENTTIKTLSGLHATLTKNVSPATPRTITLLDNEKKST